MNKIIYSLILIVSWLLVPANLFADGYRSIAITMVDGSQTLVPLSNHMNVEFSPEGEIQLSIGDSNFIFASDAVQNFSFTTEKAPSTNPDDPIDPVDPVTEFRSIIVSMANGDTNYINLYPQMKFDYTDKGDLKISTSDKTYIFDVSAVRHFSFSTEPGTMLPNSIENIEYSGDAQEVFHFDGRNVIVERSDGAIINVSLYNLDGHQLGTYTGDVVTIETDTLSQGVYIIRTNNNSFKFVRK